MTDALTISALDCFYNEVQVLHGLSLGTRQIYGLLASLRAPNPGGWRCCPSVAPASQPVGPTLAVKLG